MTMESYTPGLGPSPDDEPITITSKPCGRLDHHEQHQWQIRPRPAIYVCSGDLVVEGGHWGIKE